jgi:hypothetical protein
MIRKTWIAVLLTLWGLCGFVPSTALARHGPGRHGEDSFPAYDASSETTISGPSPTWMRAALAGWDG